MMMPLRDVSFSSIRFTTMRSYKGRMFILISSFRVFSRGSVRLDGLVAGVSGDQLAHAAVQLLPVLDEIAGAVVCHSFGAFFFEDPEQDLGFRPALRRLSERYFFEGVGDAVEFQRDSRPDLLSPLDLTGRAGQLQRTPASIGQPFWLVCWLRGRIQVV